MSTRWLVRVLLAFLAVTLYGSLFAGVESLVSLSPALFVTLPMLTTVVLLLTRDSFQHREDLARLQDQILDLGRQNAALVAALANAGVIELQSGKVDE